MRIYDEYWARVSMLDHDEREFLEIGSWPDRGTNEVLLVHLPTREVYRKRFWTSRPAGEVWFKLRLPEPDFARPLGGRTRADAR